MRVLIVDDSKAMRMIVMRSLRMAGLDDLSVEQAANGAEALAAIRTSTPDVVLSDWNMPEMTGMELLEALRAEGSEVPFGFITSEASAEMRELADQGAAAFFITKPFTPDVLRDALAGVS